MNRALRKKVKGFTMPELLVYMIISGLVFIAVMEGFSLVSRYSQRKSEKISMQNRLYEGYHRLLGLCRSADSLFIDRYDKMELYKGDELLGSLYVEDSTLLMNNSSFKDSLLYNVIAISSVKALRETEPDSLNVKVAWHKRDDINIGFPLSVDHSKIITQILKKNEEPYLYEREEDKGSSKKSQPQR